METAIQNVSKKDKTYEKLQLRSSNFMKTKTPSQVDSKNLAKIKIYVSIYIYLNSGTVASKISNRSQGINLVPKAILTNP